MISGIGLDLIEIERVKKIMSRSKKFVERILSERELAKFEALTEARKIEYLAGRFAAKEAYAKAVGTGIGKGCGFRDIEILNDELGKPELYFGGKPVLGLISITHTSSVAAAQVILLKNV